MMLPKPAACRDCPMYGDGMGFVPDRIIPGSRLTILGQNPGEDEEQGRRVVGWERVGGRLHTLYEECPPQPFVGKTGYDLEHKFLPLTGFGRYDVSYCNVLKCRHLNGKKHVNELPRGEAYRGAVQHCTALHLHIPGSTELVVAVGGPAWAEMGGPGNISMWRGYLKPGDDTPKVLATLHIADLFRDPRMDIPTRLDWAKVPKILSGAWPVPTPEPLVIDDESRIGEMLAWFKNHMRCPWLVIDTEYGGDKLDLIGIGNERDVIQIRWDKATPTTRLEATKALAELIKTVPIVFQNAMADVPIIRTNIGFDWPHYRCIHDTMQAHAVLYPEWPHDLEFLASIYGRHRKLKHLSKSAPLLYNAGDVLETANTWEALLIEFKRDPQSFKTYREENMRLLPGIDRSQQVGLRVNPDRVKSAFKDYAAKKHAAELVAQAYIGYPINLGSDQQVQTWLYKVEGMPVQKHKDTRRPTVNKDAVASLRGKILPFDPKDEATVENLDSRLALGGHPLLEARVVYAEAEQVITHYLNPLVEEK